MIRILLADDHPIVREGLRAVLETQPDFEVIAEAETGAEALRQTMALHPDILLLDLEMPVLDGVETIRRLRQQQQRDGDARQVGIIVFTAFDNDERIIHAVQAGANGYLLKGAPRDEIFKAIRITMQGGSLLQPVVASKLLRHMGQSQGLGQGQAAGKTALQLSGGVSSHSASHLMPPYETLTERELEVLNLLAQGMPNKEIASHLVISERRSFT
jgi:NarL family two-component system response regulator LiaR